ncbi:hypothetical protein BDY19DRAFT_874026, partial [Irpex rosettiformis]
PYLPIELWGVVIKHACLAHRDPLDTTHELSFLEDSSSLLDTYRVAMRDKLACCLVSRQWNAYAKEFLYEFVWISSASQAKSLAHLLILQSLDRSQLSQPLSYGSYIRRLHIETPVLELCAPLDLRSILENAPSLCIYSDHHSIQRPSSSDHYDRCSSEAILKLVAQPTTRIRRLSWTCYTGSEAPLQPRLIPLWTNLAANLEFLELKGSCDTGVRSDVFPVVTNDDMDTVHLPSLRALRMSLDDDAFAVLASWSMPSLTHLSVLSPDFTNPGPGFEAFFQSHGHKLVQLELGHKPELTEERYITVPPSARSLAPSSTRSGSLLSSTTAESLPVWKKLAEWTPNLKEFVCAADAEWHWQSADWLPRHCLLPAHPNVELIGIRGIDVRLREDPDLLSGEAYFTLFEQLTSFLNPGDSSSSSLSSPSHSAAFPNLKFLRDMSRTSDRMRREQPRERVSQFWLRLVRRCKERGVWFEDCRGVNVSVASVLRA